MEKIAVIDIGSNSSKLLVASVMGKEKIEGLFQKTIPFRLSNQISKIHNFELQEDVLHLLLGVIDELASDARERDPSKIILVGTEALRKTTNQIEIKNEIQFKTGLELTILSGKKEAEGIAKGIATDPLFGSKENFHAFDLGGGSMEIVEIQNSKLKFAESFPLGSVRLTQDFVSDPNLPLTKKEVSTISNHIRKVLSCIHGISSNGNTLAATGGSLIFCRKLAESEEISTKMMLGKKLHQDFFQSLFYEITQMGLSERLKKYPQIPEDRMDILPTAMITVLEVMKFLNVEYLTHSFHNLRFGIAANYQEFQ